ncbi:MULTISPECIES: hypothetical protein [Streptomyces]|uniref:Uncharacterized protein n=1 Tax=Streptomyces sviceus (strain ATCC 29083 / DSM 924 / JCM 4929 / NBRC 13980 / NCIMB 11184 / NRRL 5439 / UC 5370) TaxID=463191 RepID=B5HMT1_STRX2|nr:MULTISPECIES: hypothetical protein [Streptomyces]EDY54136.1 conserved hypothetical protein [Streptomyces sviceus ATCC 29083]MYT08417.1 hypothetical protein [Streptomyces sp. SID5470]
MRRELRRGDHFGVKPTPDKIKELIDEVASRFGETVEVEYSTLGRTSFTQAPSMDDLVSELDPAIRDIYNLQVTIKSSTTERTHAQLTFGESPSRLKMRLGIFPYGTKGVALWSVSHPDSAIADRIAREIRRHLTEMAKSGWRYKSGISKWKTLWYIALLILTFSILLESESKAYTPWLYGVLAGVLVEAWTELLLTYDEIRIQIRRTTILTRWRSWTPSSAAVARSTILASVLAVPTLILAIVQLFQR